MNRPRRPSWLDQPEWMRTVRFRLTVTYSTLLFGLAALVVALIYGGVRQQLAGQPVAQTYEAYRGFQTPRGFVATDQITVADVRTIEQAATAQSLTALKSYSLGALALLFLASLAIGWWLSGRALRPVEQITRTARDITAHDLSRRIALGGPDDELRRLADTIDAMLDRLDAAFTAQRRLVDDASHELRNPLAIIRTNVDAVLSRDDVTPAERAQASAVVTRATQRMSGLVEDLLATARRAAPAFVEDDVGLEQLGRDAADEHGLLAGQRGVILRTALEPVTVIGDRDALRRALANLLSNALRFSPPGGDVLVATGRRDGWAFVAVADQGPGIAPHEQQRVFDRFYRGDAPRSAHDGHAGLGLAIVRQIAESHGGEVRLHSALGRGATFVLWLPVVGSGRGSGGPPAQDPLVAVAPQRTG